MPTTLIRNTSQVVTMASGGRPKRGAALGEPGVIDGGEVLIRDGVIEAVGVGVGSARRLERGRGLGRRRGHRCRGRRRPARVRRPAHPSHLRRLAPGRVGGPARRGPLVHRADQGGRRGHEHRPPDARDAGRGARVADPGPPRAVGVVGRHDRRGEERLRARDRGGAAPPARAGTSGPSRADPRGADRPAGALPAARRCRAPASRRRPTSTRSWDRSSRPSPPKAWRPASTSSSIARPIPPTTCGGWPTRAEPPGLRSACTPIRWRTTRARRSRPRSARCPWTMSGTSRRPGFAALAASDTVAVLIPGSLFFVPGEQTPPTRALIDAGVAIALSTDYTPGTSPIASMPLAISLACVLLKLTRRRGDRGRHDQRRVRPGPGRGPRLDRARQAGRPPDPRGPRLPRAAVPLRREPRPAGHRRRAHGAGATARRPALTVVPGFPREVHGVRPQWDNSPRARPLRPRIPHQMQMCGRSDGFRARRSSVRRRSRCAVHLSCKGSA